MIDKVDEEVAELKKDILRLGKPNAEGKYSVPFGILFDDEKTQQYYEVITKSYHRPLWVL